MCSIHCDGVCLSMNKRFTCVLTSVKQVILTVKLSLHIYRCATGENWQLILLSCMDGKECDPDAPYADFKNKKCGHDMAIPYFVSFIFFCSFLVRIGLKFFFKLILLTSLI